MKRRDEEIVKLSELLEESRARDRGSAFVDAEQEAADVEAALSNCLQLLGATDDRKQIAECFALEMERLKFKLLHVRSQLDLASVHLEQSKANSEK